MNYEAPGVFEVLTGNKKILTGILLLVIGLVLAFSAVYRRTDTYSRQGILESGSSLALKNTRSDSQRKLTLIRSDNPELSETIKVVFLNDDRTEVRSELVGPAEVLNLQLGSEVKYVKQATDGAKVKYRYSFSYTYQPFRLLAIPAALLTVIGVVAVYRGFNQFMKKFAERKIEEDEPEAEVEEQGVNFMGIEDQKEEDQK
ncbi:MAG: hypothetical protein ABEJ25_08430 [Candidatus Bipolaricaulia bacterium]